MRYILLFWAVPMGLFWGWFFLSYHDINFGFAFLSRYAHDFAFAFYGHFLGIEPETIPPLVARACVVDTMIIFAIYAFRKRREIREWWAANRGGLTPAPIAEPEVGRAPPAE